MTLDCNCKWATGRLVDIDERDKAACILHYREPLSHALKQLQPHLFCCNFILMTDHMNPLVVQLQGTQRKAGKVDEKLQGIDLELEYHCGS